MEDLFAGTFGIVIIIFWVVVAVLWFLLPFAVFGIKRRLDVLVKNSGTSIVLIESLNHEIKELRLNGKRDRE